MIFTADATECVERHLAEAESAEIGGLLIGTADPVLGLVVVTGAERIETTSTGVSFDPLMWDSATQAVAERHPGTRIVGWYHSHPRAGIFLSGRDLVIHSTYFPQPWQIALVADPVVGDRGMFGWHDRQLVRIQRWSVTTPASSLDTDAPTHEPASGPAGIVRRMAMPVRAAPTPTPELRTSRGGAETGAKDDLVPASAPTDLTPQHARRPIEALAFVDDAEAAHPSGARATDGVGDAGADRGDPLPPSGRHKPRRRRRLLTLFAILLVIGAVVTAAVLIIGSRKDDDEDTPAPTATTASISAVTIPPTTASTTPAATDDLSTSTEVPTTDAPTTVSTSGSATVSTSASTTGPTDPPTSPPSTQPPTPESVASPASRLGGAGFVPCVFGFDGLYTPTEDCFVPLPNGNIVVSESGAITCVDPAGTELVAASSFLVGFGDDQSAVVANGALVSACSDLTYARNVMVDGAAVFDGLCGRGQTPVDLDSARCFAQNPTSGSMVAVVKAYGSVDQLSALCYDASASTTAVTLTWSIRGVDSTWSIGPVKFDQGTQQFVATATRGTATATSPIACA